MLLEEKDVLVNLNLMDKQEAEKNIEPWKKHSNCLPHAEKKAWTWHSKNLALSWPSSMSSQRGYSYGPIWTRACLYSQQTLGSGWKRSGHDRALACLQVLHT